MSRDFLPFDDYVESVPGSTHITSKNQCERMRILSVLPPLDPTAPLLYHRLLEMQCNGHADDYLACWRPPQPPHRRRRRRDDITPTRRHQQHARVNHTTRNVTQDTIHDSNHSTRGASTTDSTRLAAHGTDELDSRLMGLTRLDCAQSTTYPCNACTHLPTLTLQD